MEQKTSSTSTTKKKPKQAITTTPVESSTPKKPVSPTTTISTAQTATTTPKEIIKPSPVKKVDNKLPTQSVASSTLPLKPVEKVKEIKVPKLEPVIATRLDYVASKKAVNSNFTETTDTFKLNAPAKLERSKNKNDIKITALKHKPEVRLQKWGGEVNLGISYNDVPKAAASIYKDKVVRWEGATSTKKEIHAYALPESEEVPAGGFEIEVVLKEKPASNVFEFDIDGAENLDFFYQPALTKEQIKQGYSRPENVVGSYAVYHKTKKDYTLGGTNYGTGKAFHIYRPKVSDASGKTIWGKLAYNKGKLSVTVPKKFLETAEYPVVVDPTFGYQTIGESKLTANADWLHGGYYGTYTSGGTVNKIMAARVGFPATTTLSKAVIFDKTNNTILQNGVSNEVTVSHTENEMWYEYTFSNQPVVASSSTYGLGVIDAQTAAFIAFDSVASGQSNSFSDSNNNYTTPSNPQNAWNFTGERFSIYATYGATTSGNVAPVAPASLQVENQINPDNLSDSEPEFSAIFDDLDSNDLATHYQIQVADAPDFSSLVWDSGKHSMLPTPSGSRSPQINYEGTPLTENEPYYWRIRFWDQGDFGSPWGDSAIKIEDFESTFLPYGFTHTAGNNADWLQSDIQVHSGVYAAKAGEILDGETSGFEMTAARAGWLKFNWKVSSEDWYDKLCWYKNTTEQNCLSGESEWHQESGLIEAGDTVAWRYEKDGSVSSGSDTGWIDLIEYPAAATFSISASSTPSQTNVEGFENTFLPPHFTHTAGNTTNWFKSSNQAYAGTHAAEAGDIEDNEQSSMSLTIPADGDLSFYWKASSEQGWDFLCWQQNTIEQTCISGEVDWTEVTAPVTAGDTITFTYRKDSSVSNGSDTAWVDVVSFPAGNGTTTPTTNIQNLSYTYDAVGNITSIVDSSDTRTAGESTYTYDDLYRLTSATTASTTSTYQYTPIGNITSFNGTPYTYNQGTYTNPHAATTIGTTPYTYSINGNLENNGTLTLTHTYDYRNRLVSSTDGTTTSTYQYNHNNQRTKLVEGSDTTLYPFSSYHIENGTPKLYLSLGTVPVATMQGTTTTYLHTNHLTSTTKTTNEDGTITKLLDYHPYGDVRLETGVQEETTQYTGYTKDYATNLNYAGQRYYDPTRGQFMSQDPAFLKLDRLNIQLRDPQSWNSYAYARNNPIVLKDTDGEFWWPAFYTDWEGYNIGLMSKDNGLILKAGEVLGGRNAALAAIKENESYINSESQRTGVSTDIIKSIMYEEQSHQFPPFGSEMLIEKLVPNKVSGGIGVMQVSARTSGLTNIELLDPATNIGAGVGILKNIRDNNLILSNGGVASIYNNQRIGDEHANRYGDRVNSYINNQTYQSNISKLRSALINIVRKLTSNRD